jgi:hypothetical protein
VLRFDHFAMRAIDVATRDAEPSFLADYLAHALRPLICLSYPIERGCCFEHFFTKVGPIGNINEHRHLLLLRLLRIVPDFMFMAHCSPRRCF